MNLKRIFIGMGILLSLSYIIRLFGGNFIIDLAFVITVLPLTLIFMLKKDTDVVEEEDEES